MCVIHGFGLSWLTLRSKSLVPATVAHGMYNVFWIPGPVFSFPASPGAPGVVDGARLRAFPLLAGGNETRRIVFAPAEATATEAAV